ncbi:MAG: hypothetical protein GX575_23835 [Candidatus Anammoximicrobium sp.]|nr:hypothetical protein [Candidatus Anammoximicrobium sp.]
MLTKEQLQMLADGEAAQMFGPQLGHELHRRLGQAGALGEIAWQLRLAAQEKWQRGYCLRRTELEAQLRKDDCGLNWGWDEVWQRFGEDGPSRAAEPTNVLVIDLPVGQVVLNDDLYTGRRPPAYRGKITGLGLADLRIAAFVELVLQYRTPEEICYAIVCLASEDEEQAETGGAEDEDAREADPASGTGMFDAMVDAEINALRAEAPRE